MLLGGLIIVLIGFISRFLYGLVTITTVSSPVHCTLVDVFIELVVSLSQSLFILNIILGFLIVIIAIFLNRIKNLHWFMISVIIFSVIVILANIGFYILIYNYNSGTGNSVVMINPLSDCFYTISINIIAGIFSNIIFILAAIIVIFSSHKLLKLNKQKIKNLIKIVPIFKFLK